MLVVISSLLLLSCKAETLNFEWEVMEMSMDSSLRDPTHLLATDIWPEISK